MSNEAYQPTVVTPEFRLSYPHLVEANNYGGKTSWGWTMIFDNSCAGFKDDPKLSELREAVVEAAQRKFGKHPRDVKPMFHSPFRSCSEKSGKDGFEDPEGLFVPCQSQFAKPGGPGEIELLDRAAKKIPLMNAEQVFFPGCYCRAIVTTHGWINFDEKTRQLNNQGVSFSPVKLQFVRQGEAFRPQVDPEAELSAFEAAGGDGSGDGWGGEESSSSSSGDDGW